MQEQPCRLPERLQPSQAKKSPETHSLLEALVVRRVFPELHARFTQASALMIPEKNIERKNLKR